MKAEQIEEMLKDEGDSGEGFEVWPENWPAASLFLACATQWRWLSGMGAMRIGLDYPAVESAMRMMGIPAKKRPDIFDDLRTMEVAALTTWTEQRR